MDDKKPNAIGLPIGGASLLMIFIALCLTTFASIALISAHNDYKLSLKTYDAMAAYYNADSVLTEKTAQLDKELKAAADIKTFFLKAQELGAELAAEEADKTVANQADVEENTPQNNADFSIKPGSEFVVQTNEADTSAQNKLPKKAEVNIESLVSPIEISVSEKINENIILKAKFKADTATKKLEILSWSTENVFVPSDEPVYLELFQ